MTLLNTPTRRRAIRAVLAPMLLLAAVGSVSSAAIVHAPPPAAPEITAPSIMSDPIADRPLHLAPATAPPIAAPAALMKSRLADREVFAFAPYWTLDVQETFALQHVTTLAYFGVDITKEGTIKRSGNGWVGYQSQDLADLISRAHRAGIRVVLTIKAFSNDTIHAVATDGAKQGALARDVIAATKAKNFDGVNIDFEGTGNTDRRAFAPMARALADALHAANEAWQVTLDSYVSSADDAQGFIDVAAIAPAVDSFFIMAYDMYRRDTATPNAPLPWYERAIASYTQLAPNNKIILGAPFYGYDWPTQDNSPHSKATGAPKPVSFVDIAAGGHPRYWDSDASVPWTAYQTGGHWHEIYYDDASSLALKARFANAVHLRGMGAWALGMNGSNDELVTALLGTMTHILNGPSGPTVAPAAKPTSTPPPAAPASTPRPAPTATAQPKSSPKHAPTSSPAPTSAPLPLPLPTGL